MWIQIDETKWAKASEAPEKVVDLAELEKETADLRVQLASHQSTYDARVALMNQSDEPVKSIIAETLEELYAPILMTQDKLREKEDVLTQIYGNNI